MAYTLGDVTVNHRRSIQWCLLNNSSSPEQNGPHFADDIFKCMFVNENVWISIKFSLNIVPDGPKINNILALVQIMAWRWLGDKPLSEPMMVLLLMHICVTRPQWFNSWIVENSWKYNMLLKQDCSCWCPGNKAHQAISILNNDPLLHTNQW